MKIYLLRHGETDWNKEEKMAYNENLVLNENGIKQAKETAKRLKKLNYDLVIVSPFIRARQTEQLANKKDCPVIIDERIKEMNPGILDGVKLSDINTDEFFNYHINPKYEEAETLQDFCNKVWSFLDDIKEKYKDKEILLITHNIVIRAIKSYVYGIPKDGNLRRYGIKNCEVEMCEFD